MVCTLATLSASLLNGKGRGDWEALEGLCLRVGSLEGSLGLLSLDFHPWTGVNLSSSVEVVAEEVKAMPHRGGGGNSLLGASSEVCFSSSHTRSSQETCLWLRGVSPPPWLAAAPASLHTSMGTVSETLGGSPISPPKM